MYITLTPPGPVFHGRYLHSWNKVGAEKERRLGSISLRALRRRIVRYFGTLLVVEQSSLENRPRGVWV